MGSFWPNGIELSDTQSPREILQTAQLDWQSSSDGIMDLILQDSESTSGNNIIIVHAKHVASNRTAMLFSVVHRPESPYPVAILPKDEDLPDFLKKAYFVPGKEGITSAITAMAGTAGKQMLNEWVSDTPSEFRENLTEVFNLGTIKREILNLSSIGTENANCINENSLEDSARN